MATLRLLIQDVYKRVAKIISVGRYAELSSPSGISADRFGIFLWWDESYRYLNFEVTGCSRNSNSVVFEQGHGALKRVLQQVHATTEIDPAGYCWLGGVIERGTPLQISVTVDTDDRKFCEFADNADRHDNNSVKLSVGVIYVAEGDAMDEAELLLELQPATDPPKYEGFVALDLGNSSSALAYLAVEHRNRSNMVQVLPDVVYDRISFEEVRGQTTSVLSVLRVQGTIDIDSPVLKQQRGNVRLLDRLDAFQWGIGCDAETGNEDVNGLIFGPKRLVAQNDADAKVTISAKDLLRKRESAPKRLSLVPWMPAELYVCRLLQMFQALKKRSPRRLAVTYPCDGPGLADSNGRRQNAALKGEVRHVGIEDGGSLGARLGIAIKAAVF